MAACRRREYDSFDVPNHRPSLRWTIRSHLSPLSLVRSRGATAAGFPVEPLLSGSGRRRRRRKNGLRGERTDCTGWLLLPRCWWPNQVHNPLPRAFWTIHTTGRHLGLMSGPATLQLMRLSPHLRVDQAPTYILGQSSSFLSDKLRLSFSSPPSSFRNPGPSPRTTKLIARHALSPHRLLPRTVLPQ